MAFRLKNTRIYKSLKTIFQRRLKSHLLNDRYKVVEAFRVGSEIYYMFDNQYEVPTGRQLAALAVYEEMRMNCDREYLEKHCKAMQKLLSDPKKINIGYIAQLNVNLEERLKLMVMPDFVYKLASVVFFDESESPYSFDFEYAEKKIARWKEAEGSLDFFLKTPLKDLVPSLTLPSENLRMFFQVQSQVDQTHRRQVSDILSGKV